MNTSIRIISAIIINLALIGNVFADSEKDTSSGKVQSIKVQSGTTDELVYSGDEDKDGQKEEVTEAKKEKIKQEISSYIIDSYKAQGDKILKDIDQTLQKTAPEREDRIEAYKKIRTSLEARRVKNNASKKVSENSKMIVNEFLTHMIDSIDKKIAELSK